MNLKAMKPMSQEEFEMLMSFDMQIISISDLFQNYVLDESMTKRFHDEMAKSFHIPTFKTYWKALSRNQPLSIEFIKEHSKELDFYDLHDNQNLSKEAKELVEFALNVVYTHQDNGHIKD